MKSSISASARSYGGRQISASTTMPLLGGTLMLGADVEKSDGDFSYDHFATRDWRKIELPDGTTVGDRDGVGTIRFVASG